MEQSTDTQSLSSADLLSLFTTLYDDIPFPISEVDVNTDSLEASVLPEEPFTIDTVQYPVDLRQESVNAVQPSVQTQHEPDNAHRHNNRPRQRVSKKRAQEYDLPGYMCFSVTTGDAVKRPRRSAFSTERRQEVNQLRKRGACLRCRIRKIPVRALV